MPGSECSENEERPFLEDILLMRQNPHEGETRPMKKVRMTPEHPRWKEFMERLGSAEGGINVREGGKGILEKDRPTWDCDHSLRATTAILRTMPDVDRDASLVFLHEHGGECDCEVFLNVEWLWSLKLDENIRRLVIAAGGLPGVDTYEACGGHQGPDVRFRQAPEGHYYVTVGIRTDTEEGLHSLGKISSAVTDLGGDLQQLVKTVVRIHGTGDPNELADLLELPMSRVTIGFPDGYPEISIPSDLGAKRAELTGDSAGSEPSSR